MNEVPLYPCEAEGKEKRTIWGTGAGPTPPTRKEKCVCELSIVESVEGYLVHKKTSTPLGPQ